jgi:hypothetical protein
MPSDPESSLTSETQNLPGPADELEKRLVELRGRISDIGYEMDAGKAVIGMMMGGGVFLLLLAGLAAYDLLNGKAGIYAPLGVTHDMLKWIAWGGAGVGLAAILRAVMRHSRDRSRETKLAELEEEYACLKERRAAPDEN